MKCPYCGLDDEGIDYDEYGHYLQCLECGDVGITMVDNDDTDA